MAAANSAQPPAGRSTATDAVLQALDLLSRASADWRNGNACSTGPVHWSAAVPAAWDALRRALEELEAHGREGAHPPASMGEHCDCAREHCPGDCLDSLGWDADDDARAGLAWYNSATVTERRHWHYVARSAVPADAWEAYKAGERQP